MTEQEQAKIALEGPDGDIETLWADVVGENLYRLDNLPWYAYRVSLQDVVEAHPDPSTRISSQTRKDSRSRPKSNEELKLTALAAEAEAEAAGSRRSPAALLTLRRSYSAR